MISMHGSAVPYAAFAERPFAILEVKPLRMPARWFYRYHPKVFAANKGVWYWVYETSSASHRRGDDDQPQHGAAVLPAPVFQAFVCNVTRLFERYWASTRGDSV